VSLSQFNTSSPETRPGKECLYEATIANNTASSLWIRLLFNIYLSSNPVHPEGHYAYYEKRIFVQAHEDQRVKITYDWNDHAIFEIDGIQFNPDNAWSGSCNNKGKYLSYRDTRRLLEALKHGVRRYADTWLNMDTM
jgi:hypothetical protein